MAWHGALLYVDPDADPAACQQHGALLATIDRLRVEIDAAIRPPAATWHPVPLRGRPGDAVRRSLTAARDHDRPRRGPTLRQRLRRAASARSHTQDAGHVAEP